MSSIVRNDQAAKAPTVRRRQGRLRRGLRPCGFAASLTASDGSGVGLPTASTAAPGRAGPAPRRAAGPRPPSPVPVSQDPRF